LAPAIIASQNPPVALVSRVTLILPAADVDVLTAGVELLVAGADAEVLAAVEGAPMLQ
jgi:hypothetical protein